MTTITIELTPDQAKSLKARMGKRTVAAAAQAAIEHMAITPVQYERALRQSMKEEREGKTKTFSSAAEMMKWLES